VPKKRRVSDDDRRFGVLALLDQPTPMAALVAGLRQSGYAVDVVRDAAEARTAFFASGGHDCLVVAPDVRPGLARAIAASLRTVDPELPMATFGPSLGEAERPAHEARLAGFHPGSRAGIGALLRFLGALERR
jgi:hypothetical protein